LPEPYRVAVYYAPAVDDPLWTLGSAWLGRDAATGQPVHQPAIPGLGAATSSPRRYGFHATLKPPMQLAAPLPDFLAAVRALAAPLTPVPLPRLEVTRLGAFIALCQTTPSPALHALADACVIGLETFRRPEDDAAQAARAAGATARQAANIARWGYPYVLADWRFHMTLSNALNPNPLAPAAAAFFADALEMPRFVTDLAIFAEPEPGADFNLIARQKLGG
jgi:hypothetical protein